VAAVREIVFREDKELAILHAVRESGKHDLSFDSSWSVTKSTKVKNAKPSEPDICAGIYKSSSRYTAITVCLNGDYLSFEVRES
jgi:hypothetical protein